MIFVRSRRLSSRAPQTESPEQARKGPAFSQMKSFSGDELDLSRVARLFVRFFVCLFVVIVFFFSVCVCVCVRVCVDGVVSTGGFSTKRLI